MLYLLLPNMSSGDSRRAGSASEPRPRPADAFRSTVPSRDGAAKRDAEVTLWTSPHRLAIDWLPARAP